ncbi:MAG: LUD domain-containing protein [Deltaproteobacteria bacterium]|jgi:iron-sulfur cluster protein|nr:LUD domain-containing protein [Deltaproteobacteria bacterium]
MTDADAALKNMKGYRQSLKGALEDNFLRQTLDKFAVQYRANRTMIFADMNERELIAEIADAKDESMERLEELYEQFRAEAGKKGVIVHRAATAKEANDLICRIAKENNVRKIIKSKSMTAEEIHLNHALEADGLEVVETDLGEWIIQLRHEGPTHMVMPAIHLSRHQVADTFSEKTRTAQDSDISKLVKVARHQLRARFAEADMGISGANFALADTGTIGVCTNEGNGRLTTTLPRVHVAIAGIDKLAPNLHDALRIIRVLPRNATAQAITTYVSWITGATDNSVNPDRRKVFHVVFLDNGRSALLKDPKCREVLRCVRCGACANVCPVYRLVGGHRMGYVYIGAIGLILTYFFHGHDRAKNLVQNCIGCEACKDVCAAGIDLPGIIQEIRARLNEEQGSPATSSLLAAVLANRKLFHTLLRFGKWAQKPVQSGQFIRHLPEIFASGQGFRALPAISPKPFRSQFADLQVKADGSPRVGLFAGCAQDFVYPEHLRAAVRLLTAKGAAVEFPQGQSCCGLPVQMMGERAAAEKTAAGNVRAFEAAKVDYVATLCASCASHMKAHYLELTSSDPALRASAEKFLAKIVDLSSLLFNVLKFSADDFRNRGDKAAYHSPCHLCRGLGVVKEPRNLLNLAGQHVESPEEDVCCGFGGTYSLKFPEISSTLLAHKLDGVEASGAEYLVTDCPGCVMQLKGGEEKRGRKVKVEHMAEFLLRNLK